MKVNVTFVTCQRNHQLLLLSKTWATHGWYMYVVYASRMRKYSKGTCKHKSSCVPFIFHDDTSFSQSRYVICYCCSRYCCCCCFCGFCHCYYTINKYDDENVELIHTHELIHGAFVIEFCDQCCSSTHHDTCERAKQVC